MNPISTTIAEFIAKNHLVSLACQDEQELWCANCFYAFDRENCRLIILTKSTTKHGMMMLKNSRIAGTIAPQSESIRHIAGVQFVANARCLNGNEKEVAHRYYSARHPIAALIPSEVWEVKFEQIKYTNNKMVFAKKEYWNATD
ncbi:hypothetical protein EV693_11639 [Nicoletella semolina]|uniref:Uncharacterized protein n=1 Tax=Nicoletella semolina TaxID=271160 RepID=A0A4R2N514_9PAST|nr:hypothetical protein [Nicoletella semolina]MDH2924072.1 hypothetical protein [Nicoletella semolina]TCP15923.1 hypothetical protein EV693_11639 [Nicoletella semolina]